MQTRRLWILGGGLIAVVGAVVVGAAIFVGPGDGSDDDDQARSEDTGGGNALGICLEGATDCVDTVVDDGSGDTATAQRDGDHAVSARVTGLPIDADDDKTLLHVGASASVRNPTSGVVTYSAKPESSLAPVFITTGNLTNVDGALLLGGEIAGQLGPVHAAAEYLSSQLDADSQGDDRAVWFAVYPNAWVGARTDPFSQRRPLDYDAMKWYR